MTTGLAHRALISLFACAIAGGVAWADAGSGAGAGSGTGSGSGSGSGSAAVAGRRPLAVVALVSTTDPELADFAKQLDDALVRSDQLLPVSDQAALALRDPYDDEDKGDLGLAKDAYRNAQTALAGYAFGDAAKSAKDAESLLLEVAPRSAIELRAELRVVHGIALLADKPVEADAQFALAQRLAPNLALDPARYLPEVVDAFAKAHGSTDERVVEIRGTGRVWIDGRDVGAAPGPFSLTVGLHVVQLAGRDRLTRGHEVAIAASPAVLDPIAIDDAPADQSLQIKRVRTELAHAGDALARAGAMTELAKLVQVDDALVVSRDDSGALVYEVWKASTGFAVGGPQPVGADKPTKLLAVVAPPKPKPQKKFYPPPFDPPPLPFYAKRSYQIGGGVAAVVLGIVVYSLATHTSTIGYGTGLMTDGPWSGSGESTAARRHDR